MAHTGTHRENTHQENNELPHSTRSNERKCKQRASIALCVLLLVKELFHPVPGDSIKCASNPFRSSICCDHSQVAISALVECD